MDQKIFFVMGVSGSGKTTIGEGLSKELGIPFFDADDFHPEENVKKMESGKPLNDEDRAPWLDNLNELAKVQQTKKGAVITCSALKKKYRRQLEKNLTFPAKWIFLHGDFDLILKRINSRKNHFMPASLLQSQFDALEVPQNALKVDIEQSPNQIIMQILTHL